MNVPGYLDGSATVPFDTASFNSYLTNNIVAVVLADGTGARVATCEGRWL